MLFFVMTKLMLVSGFFEKCNHLKMYKNHLFEIFRNIINVLTVTFVQFNAFLLSKSINFLIN